MKILVVCDQGNSRSVTLAHQLKYLNHDVLTAGLKTNSPKTLFMLGTWADKVILTDHTQEFVKFLDGHEVNNPFAAKTEVWDLGPDMVNGKSIYPRPFNPELLKKVKALIAERRHTL